MTTLQRRIYSTVLGLHPAAFRNQFSREMMLDFDDALEQRGFTPLIGDAILSLARQWKVRALVGPELEQPVPSHPFLAGQYFMVDQGRLSAFTLARASLLSAMLLLTIGYSAGIPNRRIIANLQTVRVSHDGGIDTGSNGPPLAANPAGRERPGVDPYLTAPGSGLKPFHGVLHLRQEAAPLGKGTRASGGPPVRPVSLAEALRQLIMISVIVWITSFLLRQSPGIGRRVVLAALGLLAIAASVAFGQVPTQPAPPAPSFDAVTIKPHPPVARPSWLGIRATPDGVDAASATLQGLIHYAYGLRIFDQVSGGPDWAKADMFDMQAKMSEADIAEMKKLNSAEATARRQMMLQSLLAERFKLKVHSETKQVPVYELVVAKSSPKLKDAATDTSDNLRKDKDGKPLAGMFVMGDTTVAQGQSMKLLVNLLSMPFAFIERPVFDKTGLTGTYDFTLHWSAKPLGQVVNGVTSFVPPSDDAPSIFSALQELGLKLQPATGPIEVLVIDSVDRPSEN